MSAFGDLLRHWRRRRGLSQEALAHEAEVSPRHLSFLETGRSQPSSQMALVLGSALDLPLRSRNALLDAAGFAPAYRQTDLDEPALAPVRQALEFLLARHEPFPAFVVDHVWRVLDHNEGARRITAQLGQVMPDNALLWTFSQRGLRPLITNWPVYATEMLRRVARDATHDPDAADLLEQLLACGPAPDGWRSPQIDGPAPLVPLDLALGDQQLSLFTTITTLGTPRDITLAEVRVETVFPADAASARLLEALVGGPESPSDEPGP